MARGVDVRARVTETLGGFRVIVRVGGRDFYGALVYATRTAAENAARQANGWLKGVRGGGTVRRRPGVFERPPADQRV